MATTISSGPVIVAGLMMGSPNILPEYNPDAGPSITYQGDAIPDIRQAPLNKDNIKPGTVKSHLNYPYSLAVDAIPSTLSATNIAAAQHPASGTPLTLAGTSTGIATNIPMLPYGASSVVTVPIAMDFGFTTVNATAGNTTLVVADSTQFVVGQPLVVANVGNSGGTAALLTFVISIADATHIVVANAPLATNSSAACGTGNSWGALVNDTFNLTPTFAQPYVAAGAALLMNPYEGISRGVQVTGTTLTAGGAVTITGYDIYGQLQTQTLTLTSGTSTKWSTKTWKYITSVVPAFTDASNNISVGTSDVFGVVLRNDKWEYNNFYWAGAFLTASTGWTAADKTTPATATTGDVRGTIQIGTNGPLGSGASGGASNGSSRLALFTTIPMYNLTQGTPANSVPLYGVKPA